MVAETIRQQIGAPALFMLGAHTFFKTEDSLEFRIRGSRKINDIKVTLHPSDTYIMEFGRICGINYKLVKTYEGVFWDMLCDLIEQETGLATSL